MDIKIIKQFIKRDLKIALSYKKIFIGKILSLVFMVTILYYVSISAGSENREIFKYLLTGLAFTAIIRSALFTLSNGIENETSAGTLGHIFTLPVTNMEFLLGTSITGIIKSWIEASLYLLTGLIIFNFSMKFTFSQIPLLFILIILSSASLWGIGLIAGSMTLWTKKSSAFSWVFTALIILSGNVFFPSGMLPSWINWISAVNPAYYSLNIFRKIFLTGNNINFFAYIIYLGGLTVIYISAGSFTFNSILKKVKRKGTLEEF